MRLLAIGRCVSTSIFLLIIHEWYLAVGQTMQRGFWLVLSPKTIGITGSCCRSAAGQLSAVCRGGDGSQHRVHV